MSPDEPEPVTVIVTGETAAEVRRIAAAAGLSTPRGISMMAATALMRGLQFVEEDLRTGRAKTTPYVHKPQAGKRARAKEPTP